MLKKFILISAFTFTHLALPMENTPSQRLLDPRTEAPRPTRAPERDYKIREGVARIDTTHFLVNNFAVGPTAFYNNIRYPNYVLTQQGKRYLIDGEVVSKKEYQAAMRVQLAHAQSVHFWQLQNTQGIDLKTKLAAFRAAKTANRKMHYAIASEQNSCSIL